MLKEQVTACDKIQCLITNFNGFKRVLPNLEVTQEIWVSQSINKISFWMFVSSFSFFLNLTKKVVNLLLTMGHVTHLEALWYDCAHVSVSGIVLQIWPQEPKHCQTIFHQTHLFSHHRTLTLKLSNPLPYFLLRVHIFSAHPSLKGTRVFLRLLSQL